MSKIKGGQGSRKRKQVEDIYPEQEVHVSSVIFGLMMVTALIVAGAAFMGGSLSKVESRFANVMDSAARTVGLSVDHVSVIGIEGELADDIRLAAMVEPGENMFRADPHVIRRRVEATRRVVNVRVYRLWPDQVQIHAYAAEPVALFTNGKRWAVVDSLGREMTGADLGAHAHLVKVTGEGGDAAAPALKAAFASYPRLARRISIARRVEARRWDVTFDTGVVVRLPLDADLAEAARRLGELEATQSILQRAVKSIDIRLKDRIFISPKPRGSAALAAYSPAEDA